MVVKVASSEHDRAEVDNRPSNDNDNDNDTLREVPHPSNEGLTGKSVGVRTPRKKESVVLMKLAHWQGVQVQTVKNRVQCLKS